jgi:hypothetical protein
MSSIAANTTTAPAYRNHEKFFMEAFPGSGYQPFAAAQHYYSAAQQMANA